MYIIYICICSYLSLSLYIYIFISIYLYIYIYMHSKQYTLDSRLQGRQAAYPKTWAHRASARFFFQWASFWAHTAAVLGFAFGLIGLTVGSWVMWFLGAEVGHGNGRFGWPVL